MPLPHPILGVGGNGRFWEDDWCLVCKFDNGDYTLPPWDLWVIKEYRLENCWTKLSTLKWEKLTAIVM